MARANRHHLPGYVWHITHRCHKREFPLKFDKDKKRWTESIAVGDKEFVMETKAKLGAKAIGRRELENNEGYELKEPQSPYNRVFDPEKCSLRLKNDHIWQVS
jgi:hypothetical protein